MNSKKILLTEIFPPRHGGSGNWFYELYRRMNGEFSVITDNIEGQPQLEQVENLSVHRVDMHPSTLKNMGLISFTGLKYYIGMVRRVRDICKKDKTKIVHCGKILPEGLIGLFLKLFFGYKYLVYIHGEDIEGALLSKEYKVLVRLLLKCADCIVCNSENSVSLLKKWGEDLIPKTEVLYPGVDVYKFKKGQELDGCYRGKKVLLTVSRLQKRKGHDYLLKALPKISERVPNVYYLIIGGGEEKENLERLVNELNLQDRVEFLDGIDNDQLVYYYGMADLFILPNRRVGNDIEGLGIVLLESQSCETPVIAGDSGGTVETIRPNETGVIVDCTDIKAIEDSVVSLLNSPEKLDSMGKAGRAHVIEKFSWDVLVDKGSTIFNRL